MADVPPLAAAPDRVEVPTARGPVAALRWPGPAGAPTLVWSHANGFNATTYRRLLAPLADRFQVLAPDARGHGLSALPADPGALESWDAYSQDLLALLDTLPGPVHLAGHSLGAVVSLLAVAARPEVARSLTLVEPVLPPPAACAVLAGMRRLGLHDRLPLVARAARRRDRFPDAAAVLAAYRGRGAFATWPEGWLEDYIEGGTVPADGGLRLACAPAWEARTFATTPYDVWPRLAGVRAPACVIFGGRASTFPALSARASRRRAPRVRLAGAPEATHFLPMEAPERVWEAIAPAG